MLKKIILFLALKAVVLVGATSSSADSVITLTTVDSITITASGQLDFGENLIEAGKTLVPHSPVSLVVDGVYSRSFSVKVPRKINLVSNSNAEKKIVFNSALKGSGRDAGISGNDLLWDSDSQILGGGPVNLEFSGNILLTNLEEVGTYEGTIRIEAEYN